MPRSFAGKLGQRGPQAIDVRLDQPGMVVEQAQLQHLRSVGADLLLRVEDVLAVLPAAGVRAERRREERERLADAVVAHLPQGVGEQRVPVAVAEVDRQLDRVLGELPLDRRDQLAVLGVDRADAAEQVVVLRDLEQPLARDAASARHVLEERQHVVRALRPAERDDEQGVELPLRKPAARPVGGRAALADRDRHGVRMVPTRERV